MTKKATSGISMIGSFFPDRRNTEERLDLAVELPPSKSDGRLRKG
ncbi:hypothetical protein SMD22_11390 [Brevibacillus halotolerans]|nr:hypothetical protein SMD22_11390 [Brevibacillus halotolerans]